MANHEADPEEARETARIVALSAIKYGDLSNQASKDYIFDVDKFTSFEGNTGPYILYTIVRIKSILKSMKNGTRHGKHGKRLALWISWDPQGIFCAEQALGEPTWRRFRRRRFRPWESFGA